MENFFDTLVHVREVIKYLDYDNLEIDGDIPKLFEYVEKRTKKLPPWVYRDNSFSLFGMMMDYIIRKMLVNGLTGDKYKVKTCKENEMNKLEKFNFNTKKKETYGKCLEKYYDDNTKWLSVLNETYQLAESHYDNPLYKDTSSMYSKEDINSYIPSLQNIYKWLISQWLDFGPALQGTIEFNKEINYQHLTAHPDIVTDFAVIDIKTTANFSRIAKESFLQTLSYFVLLKLNNYKIRYMGILLPIDKEIYLFDLKNWDPTSFLNKLLNVNTERLTLDTMGISLSTRNYKKYIGNHTPKLKTLLNSLEEFMKIRGNVPCQMFLRNARNGSQSKIKEEELIQTETFIKKNKISYFTHAAYVINLCNPISSIDPNDTTWSLSLIADDLVITNFIHGKGVVVHVGSSLAMPIDKALTKMRRNIQSLLPNATESCPFILETPAGEGTDLCSTFEGLSSFYNRFTKDEKKLLKICIDTAHVWGADYEPIDYILRWTLYHGSESIALVHFNDSRVQKGSKKDAHAPVGMGFIGSKRLTEVAAFCIYNNIPMVVE